MNVKHTRRFEMLSRVRDFGNTYGHKVARVSAASEAFASVRAAIDEAQAVDIEKMSATATRRADRKRAARKRIVAVLGRCCRLARLLRARGQDVPPFERPASRSDHGWLMAGRQFAHNAGALADEFAGHGLAPAYITRVADEFEAAIRGRSNGIADFTEAHVRMQSLLRSAHLDVRRLDVIIGVAFAGDPVIQAVWKQARREEPRRDRRLRRNRRPADVVENGNQLVDRSLAEQALGATGRFHHAVLREVIDDQVH
jgi:hypothetical protein